MPIIAVLILVPMGGIAGAAVSPARAHRTVTAKAARDQATASAAAERLLDSVLLPPGAEPSQERPVGVRGLLREPAEVPGGRPHVTAHRFWTAAGPASEVVTWLQRDPPPGTRAVGVATGSAGTTLEFEAPARQGRSGRLEGLLFLTVVDRSDGGSGVRADAFEDWELPRSPLERVPAGARSVGITVSSGPGGLHREGQVTPPARHASTTEPALVARLVRIVDREPAFQLVDLPSCGPEAPQTRSIQFVFRAAPEGRVLARVSQQTPIGICDPLTLRVAGRGPYALEGGRGLLRAAGGLIGRAEAGRER